MAELIFTSSGNPDFVALTQMLDAGLRIIDGDEAPFFAQYNRIEGLPCTVVAYENGEAVGCGAYKEYEPGTVEIKRMFVKENQRGKGIAGAVLNALEQHARGAVYASAILETGRKMLPAIRLYRRSGYTEIAAYGQYIGIGSSICMQKKL